MKKIIYGLLSLVVLVGCNSPTGQIKTNEKYYPSKEYSISANEDVYEFYTTTGKLCVYVDGRKAGGLYCFDSQNNEG